MFDFEERYKGEAHWLVGIQNDMFNMVRHCLAKAEVSPRVISSVLNGNFDGKLTHLINIYRAANTTPYIAAMRLDHNAKEHAAGISEWVQLRRFADMLEKIDNEIKASGKFTTENAEAIRVANGLYPRQDAETAKEKRT